MHTRQTHLWQFVAQERTRLADFLEGLTAEDWNTPSLCEGWLVRDVAAHIILESRYSAVRDLPRVVASGFNFNTFMFHKAKELGRQEPARLIAMLREDTHKQVAPLGTKRLYVLVDLLIHTQDIKIPLGREEPIDLEILKYVFSHWKLTWFDLSAHIVGLRRRMRGLAFEAADLDWRVGRGKSVRGRAQDLLLALLGRQIVLERLSGEGVSLLAKRY
jgi:uncharacterized protein (TIGR03083 family)